ncbi:site-specific integrase [Paenibacillus sinopodophylli]|uniref:site-specific integrase n=1 Tax=Paenibacillus sinopodophylli TaxID=1837342 RepID=UPI00110CDC64|nr:site-specific integrase [Paenibacillus sinopodophylli]
MPVMKNDATGNWDFKINYKDKNGEYKQKMRRGFRTQKEAKAAMAEMENDLNKNTFFEPSKTSFNDFMRDFLNDKKLQVKPQTLTTYTALINNHILPFLGEFKLSELTPRLIQNLYNRLFENGELSDENIQKCHTLINAAMKKAVTWDMIQKNPTSIVPRPKARKKEMQVWSLEESKQFLEAAAEDPLAIVFVLALTTGMRQGEILGLRWKDVDFDNRIISITQILNHDGKGFDVGAKTLSGQRPIKVDTETMNALNKHRIKQREGRMKYADVFEDNGLVVCTRFGSPVSPRNLNRTFDRIVETLNEKLVEARAKWGYTGEDLKKIRFHDMRHSHVTFLIKNRETPQAIAERLGWSDTRMIDNYAHIRPDIQEDVADTFGKAFYGTK